VLIFQCIRLSSQQRKNAVYRKRTIRLFIVPIPPQSRATCIMSYLLTRFLQLLTSLLLTARFYVQGYTMSRSCSQYNLPGSGVVDLIPTIKESMGEAKTTAEAGEASIKISPRNGKIDNSRSELFRGAEDHHFQTVYSTYATINSSDRR
jgi:hypothetical protein